MSTRRGRLLAVALVGLAQLAVPAWMIASRERTLDQGTQWRFRTAPVDPADAFRGNYLALDYAAAAEAAVPRGLEVEAGDRVFVPIRGDREGFAALGPVRTKPPAEGDWLRARVHWVGEEQGTRRARLELPFDRFYLGERDAPRAEAAFARLRGAQHRAWALVRVRDGKAVLEDLVIQGRSLRRGG